MKYCSNIKAKTSTIAIISPTKVFLLSRAITFYLWEIPSSFLHMQQPHPSTMFSQSFKLNQVKQQKLFWMHYRSKFKGKIFMFLTWTSKLRHLGLDFGIFNCIFGFLTIQNLPVPIFMIFTHLYVKLSIILTWPLTSRSRASNLKRPFWAKF